MLAAYVTTYAGLCGEPGFKDGPIGLNRLNYPDNMGIDLDGNLYVYDSGNKYIRFIDTQGNNLLRSLYMISIYLPYKGNMKTLLNGACFEYDMDPLRENKFIFDNNKILCLRYNFFHLFRNWVKSTGKPDGHIYIAANYTKCEKNYVECGNTNPLVYDRNKTLYPHY